jgi:hypothetical protein
MLFRKGVLLALRWTIGLLFFVSALAADKPNFTGTWIRDMAMSDSYTTVIGPAESLAHAAALVLKIEHRGKRLQLEIEPGGQNTRKTAYDLRQGLGRNWHGDWLGGGWHGDVRHGLGGTQYRTKWRGADLIIEKRGSFPANYGRFARSSMQEWILSAGGTVLTVKTTIDNRSTKEVFVKQKSTP